MANGDIRLNLRTAGQTQGNSFASVTVKKNLWPLILANLSLAKGSSVAVGWPGTAAKTKEQHDGLSGLTNAQVAVANEVGSAPGVLPKVPARPMIGETMRRHGPKYRETMHKMFQMIAAGKMSTNIALERLGRGVQGDLKKMIREPASTWKPANAPFTIARKSKKNKVSDIPLVASGNLFRSVTWLVTMKSGVRSK